MGIEHAASDEMLQADNAKACMALIIAGFTLVESLGCMARF